MKIQLTTACGSLRKVSIRNVEVCIDGRTNFPKIRFEIRANYEEDILYLLVAYNVFLKKIATLQNFKTSKKGRISYKPNS